MGMGSSGYRFLKSFFGKIDYYKYKILEISITKMIFLFIITLFALTSFHFLLFMYGYVSIGAGDTFLHDHVLYNTIKGNGLLAVGDVASGDAFHYPEYWSEWYHPFHNNYFECHKKVILVLMLPIYYLCPSLFTILLIQCVMLGLAAYPLYKICNHFLSESTSKIITISYFLYPTTILTGIVGFHVPTFAPLFVFSMFYFYLNKKPILHLISLILLLTLFENMFLVSIPIALYYVFDTYFNKENLKARLCKYSLPVISATIVYYGVFIHYIIGPIFSPDALLVRTGSLSYHFGYIGSDIQEIILNSLSNPYLIINVPHGLKFVAYMFVMLFPLAFIPLLNKKSIPVFLISSLILVQSVLSQDPTGACFYDRFQAIVVPFLFLAVIISVSEFQKEKYLKYFDKYYIYYISIISIFYCLWYVLSYLFKTRIYAM